ncbi:MAG: hypothetical protein COZ69_05980 [Deltaproteobacteria bacterium CG_4_8_14_3_um_filter_45_9]|nr:MAG: hypothetical protein COS40_13665 [Deltaproteobacteria bacterium CG03_land_8_20_14_0_80_45_14]PIX24522.1 MAG: hypothetical protein COZ69_05980 [Deltaproteobacteria bacterium CG_4_8_14_3_um_filter_45_9]
MVIVEKQVSLTLITITIYRKANGNEAKMVYYRRFGSGIFLALQCIFIPCPKIAQDSHSPL